MLLRGYIDKDGAQQIVIRIEHAGRQRIIPVGYKVEEKHWSGTRVVKHRDQMIINAAIVAKEAEIKRYLADCANPFTLISIRLQSHHSR